MYGLEPILGESVRYFQEDIEARHSSIRVNSPYDLCVCRLRSRLYPLKHLLCETKYFCELQTKTIRPGFCTYSAVKQSCALSVCG